MLEALSRRYDFLDDVLRPPPVGPLADALGAMKEKRAAPLLAAQLNEPTNSTSDVKRAAKALETLATDAELPDVRTFFTLYRATADDDNMVSAVLSAAQVLVRVGGDAEKDLVKQAASDPLTQPQIKQGLSGLASRGG
jgi:outer membrane protein assembly factor BamB